MRAQTDIAAAPLSVLTRDLGLAEYVPTWDAMRDFTQQRTASTPDEIWYLQHPPVFTQGLNGRREHLLAPGDIPVVNIDRGGQVTYHGPGQLVAYLLLDLHRREGGVKLLVQQIEQAVIELLAELGIAASRLAGAPGIYVDGSKIAALGLRIRRGMSYHGLALNVQMDLSPFQRINPCGYAGMPVTQLADLLGNDLPTLAGVQQRLHHHLLTQLGYNGGHE
ncbi:MAG: lipoyl(octanoyl) transferase LipB [Gammaproteobacteria bacterium]|nr:lipoyl(octanoyl) transferase LipB [Gammaproteobacteria bacterium]